MEKEKKKRSYIYLKGIRTVPEAYAKRRVTKLVHAKEKYEKRFANACLVIAILAALLFFEMVYTSNEIAKLDAQVDELIYECNTLRLQVENYVYPNAFDPMKFEETTVIVKETDNLPEKYNSIPLDNALKNYIYTSATKAGIPAELLFSLAWKESTFNPSAKSGTSDYGLFQINECNFSRLSKEFGYTYSEFSEKIYDPYVNTDCAIYILKEYRDNYNNDNYHQLLMRYNMGPGGAAKAFKSGSYSSNYSRATLDYAKKNFGLDDISIG